MQAEFDFVVRINEVELPVQDFKMFLADYVLKKFDGTARLFDVEQFLNDVGRLASPFEHLLVGSGRKQVEPRKMTKPFVATNLLMSAKRHLPCGKRHEDNARLGQIKADVAQELPLVVDMFQNVVAEYEVEAVMKFRQLENIGRNELAFHAGLAELFLRRRNARGRHIDSRHVAAAPREGHQVSAVAAPYFKHIKPLRYRFEPRYVWQKVFFTRPGQFPKVLNPVFLTFLHLLENRF